MDRKRTIYCVWSVLTQVPHVPAKMQNTVLEIFPVPPAPHLSIHMGLLFWPLSWLVCHPCSWMLYQRNPIMFVWDMFTDLRFVVLVVVLGKPRLQHPTPMVLHWVVPSSSGVRVGWRPVVCSPPGGHLDSFWYLVFINSMFAQVFVQTWCFHFLLVTTEELDYRVNYTCL